MGARLQVECMAITVWVEILSWIAASLAVLLVRQCASTSWAQMVNSSFAHHQRALKSWSHELIGDRVMNSHEVVTCIARQYVARLRSMATFYFACYVYVVSFVEIFLLFGMRRRSNFLKKKKK